MMRLHAKEGIKARSEMFCVTYEKQIVLNGESGDCDGGGWHSLRNGLGGNGARCAWTFGLGRRLCGLVRYGVDA